MALWEGFFQAGKHVFDAHHWLNLQVSTQHNHVESLAVFHFKRRFHRIDAIHIDVGACGWLVNTVTVVDEHAAGLHLALKAVEALLVEHNGCVVHIQDWRTDAVVAQNHGHVGCTATLLWSVRRHPSHFLIVHQARISQNLAH